MQFVENELALHLFTKAGFLMIVNIVVEDGESTTTALKFVEMMKISDQKLTKVHRVDGNTFLTIDHRGHVASINSVVTMS